MRKKKKKNEQSGELVVVGQSKVIIPLRDFPHRIEVHFKRKQDPSPCNPHPHPHNDTLEYEVHRQYHAHCYSYHLVIKWNVTSIREIFWHAYYC